MHMVVTCKHYYLVHFSKSGTKWLRYHSLKDIFIEGTILYITMKKNLLSFINTEQNILFYTAYVFDFKILNLTSIVWI